MKICRQTARRFPPLFVVVCLALFVSGCVTEQSVNPDTPLPFGAGQKTILLMPIDVELFELTVGGLEDPRADWTEAANKHVVAALRKENERRGLNMISFDDGPLGFEEAQELRQIIKLHQAVGIAMLQHQRIPALRLPTKKSIFDWSLGDSVRPLRGETDARYALFLYMKDSYASGGRVALNIVTAILFGVAQGGTQIGYASLVNLDTGQIAWFSSLARGTGDLRTQEAADEAIGVLLEQLPGS